MVIYIIYISSYNWNCTSRYSNWLIDVDSPWCNHREPDLSISIPFTNAVYRKIWIHIPPGSGMHVYGQQLELSHLSLEYVTNQARMVTPAFMQQFCHRQLLRSVPPPSSTSPLLPWCGGSRVFGMEYLCRPVASMDLWCLTWIHQDWPSNFLEFPSVVRQGQTWWWVYFRLRCSFFFAVGLVFVDLKRICTIDMSHIYVYIYIFTHVTI